ncbi:hypothetical protein Anapl_03528 [Anas platyrhynchos]|uniref:Uncharacterized protein n=1 Tax=Anas platyrhynchos TaxID=8839 RepID=R0LHI0_ANAPL|nr:hypothetical protein Anapl_03528 [Anas platyrhynchos]
MAPRPLSRPAAQATARPSAGELATRLRACGTGSPVLCWAAAHPPPPGWQPAPRVTTKHIHGKAQNEPVTQPVCVFYILYLIGHMYHRLDSYKLNTTLTFSAYGYETCGTPAELYGYETCSVHTELTKSTFTAVFCNAKNPSRQDFGGMPNIACYFWPMMSTLRSSLPPQEKPDMPLASKGLAPLLSCEAKFIQQHLDPFLWNLLRGWKPAWVNNPQQFPIIVVPFTDSPRLMDPTVLLTTIKITTRHKLYFLIEPNSKHFTLSKFQYFAARCTENQEIYGKLRKARTREHHTLLAPQKPVSQARDQTAAPSACARAEGWPARCNQQIFQQKTGTVLQAELAVHLCLLFSPIIVWTEKLKTAAELSSVWLHEICLLGCEWKQVATTGSSFAVTLAWLFPAPARAPLPMTVSMAGDVQTHSGYVYKGPASFSCFTFRQDCLDLQDKPPNSAAKTDDNQEPYDAMFPRSIYQSYSIDPAANMPEPRLPGHNGPVHHQASRDSTSSGMPYRVSSINWFSVGSRDTKQPMKTYQAALVFCFTKCPTE